MNIKATVLKSMISNRRFLFALCHGFKTVF